MKETFYDYEKFSKCKEMQKNGGEKYFGNTFKIFFENQQILMTLNNIYFLNQYSPMFEKYFENVPKII